jgi:hypothetical protein
MARSRDAPSHGSYSQVRVEEAVITDVNRKTYTVTCDTRHSNKTVEDIQCLVPYHHYENGEGIHHLPEVGAKCYLFWPSDNTPPFILGYIGAAGVRASTDGEPERSTPDGTGSPTDVEFKSRRPDLQPGDIAFTTRDENFVVLRRGGILQLGATPIAQRIYIPILNYIKDFCENYEMNAFGGDIAWTVGRVEDDPGGDAPATWTFHANEFAQDEKATVRIRHLPVTGPSGGDKAAWEVYVAKQNIDRDTGEVSDEKYSMLLTVEGEKTEMIGSDYSLRVKGNHTVQVDGDISYKANGTATLEGGSKATVKAPQVITDGNTFLGSESAAYSNVFGEPLVVYLTTVAAAINGIAPGSVSPPVPTQLLSNKVKTS